MHLLRDDEPGRALCGSTIPERARVLDVAPADRDEWADQACRACRHIAARAAGGPARPTSPVLTFWSRQLHRAIRDAAPDARPGTIARLYRGNMTARQIMGLLHGLADSGDAVRLPDGTWALTEQGRRAADELTVTEQDTNDAMTEPVTVLADRDMCRWLLSEHGPRSWMSVRGPVHERAHHLLAATMRAAPGPGGDRRIIIERKVAHWAADRVAADRSAPEPARRLADALRAA